MKLNYKSRLLMLALMSPLMSVAQIAGEFRTIASGDWKTAATWEKYVVSTSWTPNSSYPTSSTPRATVRSGHNVTINATVGDSIIVIDNGGKIRSDGTGQYTLRVIGTSFVNNGTLGGAVADDSVTLEVTTNGGTTCTLSGTGTTLINRLRAGVLAAGVSSNIIIDQDMTFNNKGVGLTAYYNSSASSAADNINMTINTGRTVTLKDSTALHITATTTANPMGAYTYNINGTLDMSGSYANSCLTPSSVTSTSALTVNVGGLWKLGYKLRAVNTSPSATNGTVALNIAAGGIVDASANATLDLGNVVFVTNGTGIFKRTVAAIDTLFPIAITAAGNNSVLMHNNGTADVFSVSLKNSFTDTWSDPTKMVTRQWTIAEATAGGSDATITFKWLTADQGAAFTTTSVSVYRDSAGKWIETPATISGAGTVASPYTATISGVKAFNRFVIGIAGLPTPTTGIAGVEAESSSIVVAPNPVTGKTINLSISNLAAGTYQLVVTNMAGQKVYANTVNHNASVTRATVALPEQLATGIYELQLYNEAQRLTRKLIVQ